MKRATTIILLVLLAIPVMAQDDPTDELWEPKQTDARSITKIRERFKDRTQSSTYIDAFTDLREGLRTSQAWGPTPSAQRTKTLLDDQLRTVIEQLEDARLLSTPEGSTEFLVRGHTTERFRFDDVTKQWFDLFDEPGATVSLADLAQLPLSAAEDFRYRVETAHVLLKEFGASAIAQTRKDIQTINARWDLFLNKGPSQYPWESFLNGLLIDTTFEMPPSHQYIILHPLPVVEITKTSLDDLQGNQAFAVELLGYAHYTFTKTATPELRWWGVSATAGIHENRKPSIGVLGHYNRTITAGVLWNDESSTEDTTIILGLDLYQLVKKKVPEYRDRLRKITAWKDRLSN